MNVQNTNSTSNGCIIVVEGNIASGKTTFIKKGVEHLTSRGIKAIGLGEGADDRPISPLLKAFYANPIVEAYPIQIAFSIHLYDTHRRAEELKEQGYIVFMDRSYIGKRVFTELQYIYDNILPNQYERLNDMMDTHFDVDHIIYIDVPPKVCFQRQKRRRRDGEITPLSYLQSIDREYKQILKMYRDIPKTQINWNCTLDEGVDMFDAIFNQIFPNYQTLGDILFPENGTLIPDYNGGRCCFVESDDTESMGAIVTVVAGLVCLIYSLFTYYILN